MVYVALLRGINVGGKTRVEMIKLKQMFETLGFTSVKTYINSGNVIFQTDQTDTKKLCSLIETAIEKDFGFTVPVLVRSIDEIKNLIAKLPRTWVNDQTMKCDVMFLWDEIDRPEVVKQMPVNSAIEDLLYLPGAVVWRIDRKHISQGRMVRVVGTDLHKKMTIRNPNTVRKLYELMQAV